MQVRKRPKSLTVIAVIMIVLGVFWSLAILGNVILIIAWGTPIPKYAISCSIAAVFGATTLISGVAILKGFRWGRWLYLCLYPFNVIASATTYWLRDVNMAPTVIGMTMYYIISLIILTRPATSKFFWEETMDE